jgi:hypothetical protein
VETQQGNLIASSWFRYLHHGAPTEASYPVFP